MEYVLALEETDSLALTELLDADAALLLGAPHLHLLYVVGVGHAVDLPLHQILLVGHLP